MKQTAKGKYIFVYGVRLIDIINPYKWVSYIKGTSISVFLERHYMEQLLYRSFICRPCIDNKKCLHCGCDAWGKMLDPKSSCSAEKWGPMQSKEQWNRSVSNFGISYIFKAEKK